MLSRALTFSLVVGGFFLAACCVLLVTLIPTNKLTIVKQVDSSSPAQPATHSKDGLQPPMPYQPNWDALLLRAREQDLYTVKDDDPSHVHIIALRRLPERKRATVESLASQGVSYTLFDAEDGLDVLDLEYVRRYAGKDKSEKLLALATLSKEEITKMHQQFKAGGLSKEERLYLHHRLKFSCFLSHVRLWHKQISAHRDAMVIFEDDAIAVPNFKTKFLDVLRSLPVAWDILFLNACFYQTGDFVRKGFRQYRGGACTLGYAISLRGAFKLSHDIAVRSDSFTDLMISEAIRRGTFSAYLADPPLVGFGAGESTLGYATKQNSKQVQVSDTGAWVLPEDYVYLFDESLAFALLNFLKNKSVTEFGAGKGLYTSFLRNRGVVVNAYDGVRDIDSITDSQVSFADLTERLDLAISDWVLCLEVAVHVPTKFEETLLDNLHRHNHQGVIISWADPTQPGVGHVNGRTYEYVQAVFEHMRYVHDANATSTLRTAATLPWFKKNVAVFRKLK